MRRGLRPKMIGALRLCLNRCRGRSEECSERQFVLRPSEGVCPTRLGRELLKKYGRYGHLVLTPTASRPLATPSRAAWSLDGPQWSMHLTAAWLCGLSVHAHRRALTGLCKALCPRPRGASGRIFPYRPGISSGFLNLRSIARRIGVF